MFKRISALGCCLVLLLCFAPFASARPALPDFTVSRDEWNANWEETGDVNTNVCLTPGADETQLRFTWHAPLGAQNPAVTLSKNPDMSAPVVFAGTAAPADEGFLACRVAATGLEPDTAYYYTYGTDGLTYGPYFFRTVQPETFKFLFVNDIHQGYDANNMAYGRDTSFKIHSVLNTALQNNPDAGFLLSGGDQIRSGYVPGEWNALLASPVLRSLPVAFAVGNHDKSGDMMRNYVNNPNEFDFRMASATGRDYWFRYGSALFLVFDSTNGNASEHLRFAKDAVGKNPDAVWRIGMLHHDIMTPAYPVILPAHVVFTEIADRAGLDVMLRGHSHIYGRSHFMKNGLITGFGFSDSITDPEGTMYISMNALQNETVSDFRFQNLWTAKRVYGTAAVYSTFEVSADRLVFKAFSPAGELRDSFTVIKTKTQAKPFEEPAGPDLYKIVEVLGLVYALFDFVID
ncbi:MAG TPA: FN3 domain-containing metallophosphoesterase family protein [Clostridiales bacterium]|nr:MAG: Calcineurin-like phosphoesterase [Firmicutes bacterium ADurb.Bin262]HOU09213.1 FN3 domain-containing metallophosphoesterase family protein [Clostridiales bacterium]HQH62784.1 FN3 domain-containing metallophosphoesterase family protein [Clostridiales bacterium]